MSAPTTVSGVEPSRATRRVGLFLAIILILLVAALLAAAAWFTWTARSALPQLDGTLALPGLSAPVNVTRDAHGTPTIEAANVADLFFAQGFITAQDRLWQMDGMSRFAAGDLSEVLGPEFLKHDREQRILGLRQAAHKSAEMLSPEDRARFETYARGVNSYIAMQGDRLPVEFRLAGYRPHAWTVEDSMLIAAQMVKDLNHGTYRDALAREKVLAKLGPELTADLYVNSSWHDRPPTVIRTPPEGDDDDDNDDDEDSQPVVDSPGVQQNVASARPEAEFAAAAAGKDSDFVVGSNNWVVSGEHTVSGKPLLSNDMHLGHQMPNLWYSAHLRCGDFDVAGVTLPGMPFVIVGHNRRIAWGFTNVGPTVEDVYVENFNAAGQYQTPKGWENPERRREIIHVKGQADVVQEVVSTRHGPIITSLIPGETRQLALRWTLYDGMHNPFFAVNSAGSWEEFQKAFSVFDEPGQNVVYADVDGNIGYHATGKVPIRAGGDGSLPENGSDDAHEWTGYIPFDKLPTTFNPASGIIATANSRITPDGYPYSISTGWEAPWRSARIYRVLESGKKFSAADMLTLQTDIYSEIDRFMAEKFVYAVDQSPNASRRAHDAAEIMRGWDGRMLATSAAPTLAVRSRYELVHLLLEPKLGKVPEDEGQAKATLNWKTYRWGMQSVWLENVVDNHPKRWLPGDYHSYDELLEAAVEAAVSDPEAPRDLNAWYWGDVNAVEIDHPVLGRIPWMRRWAAPGVQRQSGSGFTVKAVTRSHGPSERITDDLSDLDHSTLNLVTGEGGNFMGPFYMDQWKAWHENSTFPLPFSQSAVASAKAHEMTLQPK